MAQAWSGEYSSFAAVTASDTTRINCRCLYIGGAGNVALSIDGTTAAVMITGVPAGTFLPIELNQGRVMSTNTTATSIVALS